eukprot:CAMPEP_0203754906 /NCGR_PEP_ID=MMETSP0098-20131031/8452_1 /ASSEMBLY_ACC=CAM_ASM_000208 /TAXON_ID=96639 /ORGANISM=" , Strain NY0313808BC1" /LENGTH=64 /DNA_ID=CAMNT_0050646147 /DNA_START=145 /DNA_END=335 /DNA_ORIENTATION=-
MSPLLFPRSKGVTVVVLVDLILIFPMATPIRGSASEPFTIPTPKAVPAAWISRAVVGSSVAVNV